MVAAEGPPVREKLLAMGVKPRHLYTTVASMRADPKPHKIYYLTGSVADVIAGDGEPTVGS